MTCCSAYNCKNRTEQGFHMYRFPSLRDKRYIKWLHNMRRGGNWKPSSHSRLCEKHFETSQFESRRQDGLVKLRPNAIPTLFDVPNPPPLIDPDPRKPVYKDGSEESHKPVNSSEFQDAGRDKYNYKISGSQKSKITRGGDPCTKRCNVGASSRKQRTSCPSRKTAKRDENNIFRRSSGK